MSYPLISVGDRVRCYDFVGIPDCYIEGVVTGTNKVDILFVKADTKRVEDKTRSVDIEYHVPENGCSMFDNPSFPRVVKI